MAEKLLHYYRYIGEVRGLEGKIQLAKETKIPSIKAAMEPDNHENIDRFRQAIQKITGQAAPVF